MTCFIERFICDVYVYILNALPHRRAFGVTSLFWCPVGYEALQPYSSTVE